jgi:iron complex outermembrane receptor protein
VCSSDLTTIPDVLRTVSGVQVMDTISGYQEVSIRGYNRTLSNHILVMIDGIPVNWGVYDNVVWSMLPVGLDEIQRIEVVKSPVSSLYGSEAYSGVINIITKSPKEIDGTQAGITGGDYKSMSCGIINGMNLENFSYKASASWNTTNEWGGPSTIAPDNSSYKFNALVNYSFDDDKKMTLSGGRVYNKNIYLNGTDSLAILVNGMFDYINLDLSYSGWTAKAYFREQYMSNMLPGGLGINSSADKTFEYELHQILDIAKTDSLLWGVTGRNNETSGAMYSTYKQTQSMLGAFIDNTYSFTDFLKLTIGCRYDYSPLTKNNFSPRAQLLIEPNSQNIIKFSASQAFRNPSYIENYVHLYEGTLIYSPPGAPTSLANNVFVDGSTTLKPEEIISYEAEYRLVLDKINAHLNGFYNRYTDMIYTVGTSGREYAYYSASDLMALGWPAFLAIPYAGKLPKQTTIPFNNTQEAEAYGGEAGIDTNVTNWLSAFVNYSFELVRTLSDTQYPDQIGKLNMTTPRNKVNFGLNSKFSNGFFAGFDSSWVDNYATGPGITSLFNTVNAYIICNANIGYTFWNNNATIHVAVFNIFDNKHYEAPITDTDPSIQQAALITRMVSGGLTVKF